MTLLCACAISHEMQPLAEPTAGPSPTVTPIPEDSQEPLDLSCEARHEGAGAAVRWFGPRRDDDRRRLAAWCTAVGPVELRPRPTSAASAATVDDHTLTVATWNVHVGGGDVEGFLRAELGYECDSDAAPSHGGHFALLTQEALRVSDAIPDRPEGAPVAGQISVDPPSGPRRDIVEIAERCGLALFYVPSMRNGARQREDRGNAILSDLPLTDPVAIELPLEAQRRVTLVASVQVLGGSPLRLANVHFDVAGNILRVLGTGGSMRVRQNDGLTEALSSLDPGNEVPIVVAGDINTWSYRETVVLRMLEEYPDSPPPGRVKTRGDWPPDHLFFGARGGALQLVEGSYRVASEFYGSDHRARLATFTTR